MEVLTKLSVLLFILHIANIAKVLKKYTGEEPSLIFYSAVCRKFLRFSSEKYFLPPIRVETILPCLIYLVRVSLRTPKSSAASSSEYKVTSKILLGIAVLN